MGSKGPLILIVLLMIVQIHLLSTYKLDKVYADCPPDFPEEEIILKAKREIRSADTEWSEGDSQLIVGGASSNLHKGGPGDDCIIAGSGDDTLMGGEGIDILIGGPGSDSYIGEGGNDIIYCKKNHDVVIDENERNRALRDDVIAECPE
jgi:Ca2+-binding RTX toxin-like protein